MKKLNFRKLTLSQQFLTLTMVIITLLLAGVLAFMIANSISTKNELYRIMAKGRTSATIEKIDRNFYERFGDVQAFAVNPFAIQSATNKSSDKNIQRFINTMISYYVLYDLMMVIDINGNAVAVNTMNRAGKEINSKFLIGKDFSKEEWFTSCISGKGLQGGAWYSDFMQNNDVKIMEGNSGHGLVFASPIKDESGKIVGVWYNFANWNQIVTGIRKETEDTLKKSVGEAFIIVTNKSGKVIESDDEQLNLQTSINISTFNSGVGFNFFEKKINNNNYVLGSAQGKGAYTYSGKNWIAMAFIPKAKFTYSFVLDNILYLLVLIVITLIIIAAILYKFSNAVSTNIFVLKNAIGALMRGELVDVKDSKMENEIGAMTKNLQSLVSRTIENASFAKQIGEGNLSVPFAALSGKDELGNALITMRNNLIKIKEEEKRRSWATAGLAKFSEILRSDNNMTELCHKILASLVKYLEANQGGIFILQGELGQEQYFELVSSYAYDKKKFQERRIEMGEGLVGQCCLEKETIYLTDVPEEYVNITSGLGMANPTSILIVPLKINDNVEGVLELASFKVFDQHEITFIEKLAENICSSISGTKANERTHNLLKDSQMLTEQLRAQEEEMRQNLEELIATQEESSRKEIEYINKIAKQEKIM